MENRRRRLPLLLAAAIAAALLSCALMASAREVKPGTVVKSTTGSTLYLVTSAETLSGIPSPEVYNCLQLSRQDSYNMGQAKIDQLKKSKLLLKGPDGKIYLIEGTRKRHIVSPAVFQAKGFDISEVVTVSAAKLSCIPDGEPLR